MRIMLVTDQYPPMVGGVPTVTHGLALDFAQRGHQVWVVAPSYDAHDERRMEQEVRVYRFSSIEWPAYEGLRIPFLPFMPVRNLIRKTDPDIIHIHSPIVLGNIAQILAGGLRKPVIATNHYLPINISPSLTIDPFIGKSFNRMTYSYLVNFLNRCEYVTAPTQTAMNLLYENGLRVPARVISNGIDLAKFTPGPRDPDLLRHFELPTNRPLLLHVNRLSEEKRVDVLLDAMSLLKSNAHLVLVSTGPAETELRAQAERLQLQDRVSFLGYVPDQELLQLRRSSDLFVIPSEADLQSLATMEAMACGLPVVAANAYALPELVHHQKNGLLFPRGDSAALASAIDQLLDDSSLRMQMGQESLRIVLDHDRVHVLNEWEILYNRLSVEFREAKQRRQHQRTLSKYADHLSSDLPRISQPRVRLSKDPDFQRRKKSSRSKII